MEGLDGAGTAGLVSVAAGVSVLVAVVFFFLEKRVFSLSRGDSSSTFVRQRAPASDDAIGVFGFNHTTHVDEEVE